MANRMNLFKLLPVVLTAWGPCALWAAADAPARPTEAGRETMPCVSEEGQPMLATPLEAAKGPPCRAAAPLPGGPETERAKQRLQSRGRAERVMAQAETLSPAFVAVPDATASQLGRPAAPPENRTRVQGPPDGTARPKGVLSEAADYWHRSYGEAAQENERELQAAMGRMRLHCSQEPSLRCPYHALSAGGRKLALASDRLGVRWTGPDGALELGKSAWRLQPIGQASSSVGRLIEEPSVPTAVYAMLNLIPFWSKASSIVATTQAPRLATALRQGVGVAGQVVLEDRRRSPSPP